MIRHTLILASLAVTLLGQSPYYRLGYGDIYPKSDPFAVSVGSGIVALEDSSRAIQVNPASINGLKRVYFEFALGSSFTATDLATVNNTRFEQVRLTLPLGSNVGLSLEMKPVADLESIFMIDADGRTLSEQTYGGLWDYSVGVGYEVNDKLELGIRAHLLHGTMRRVTSLSSDDVNTEFVLKGQLDGGSLEFGAVTQLGPKVRLGLTTNFPTTRPILSGRDSLSGTDSYHEFDENLSAWPTRIQLGVVYKASKRNQYLVGLGQEIYPEEGFANATVFGLADGWEVVPVGAFDLGYMRAASDRNSRDWTKRVGLQTSVSIKNHYLCKGTDNLIYEMSWNSGINLVLRNGRSIFDISTEIGSRSGEDSFPAEQFARLKLGIQVNDIWFKKVKRR